MMRIGLLGISLGFVLGGVMASPLGAQVNFRPTGTVVLNTSYQQIGTQVYRGGIFVFNQVRIDAGVHVTGQGPNPLILVSLGDFIVDGVLDGDGQDGPHVTTLNSANFPAPGGLGGPAGGAGGAGSPGTTARSPSGATGQGPLSIPGLGGKGGTTVVSTFAYAPGGGGGSFATVGDPHFAIKFNPATPANVQQIGFGGWGLGLTIPFLGGAPGPRLFLDGKANNDFWGLAVDVNSRTFIPGEIAWPFGGSGGGGGGDLMASNMVWVNDRKGAGGGGGGGVVLVYALGKIVVGAQGRISADGGDGGGGEWAGSNRFGGGGGGGSGGMVILMTRKSIDLHVHGKTYGEGDTQFSVSADGGIGSQSAFGGLGAYLDKYSGNPTTVWSRNTGGLGGMGVVQFATPIDGKNADGTNTILDDMVNVLQNGKPLTGAAKQKYLAWRGFPNSQGIFVDDAGIPIRLGDKDGDIRPAPILMPIWF